jgi:uncharacterized repeat protein (TIGR01451 family)
MRTPKRLALILTMFMIGAASGSLAIQPSAFAGTVGSAGPLVAIAVTPDLNCAVNHIADPAHGAFYNDTACGTLVAVNGTLFGPEYIPAGFSAGPRTAFTPVSQSAVTGTGAAGNPFTIVTVVDLGGTGVQLTQTDTYLVGEETYRTDVSLAKSGGAAVDAIVYRAGDCYLGGSDDNYGLVGSPEGAIACTADPAPNAGGQMVQWIPITSGSRYRQGRSDAVWAAIGLQKPLPNTCSCDFPQFSGAGLSWSVSVPVTGATVVSSQIKVTGGVTRADLSVTMTDTPDPVASGANLSYATTVTNAGPNAASGVNLSIETPAHTSFVSLTSPAGWVCTTPQTGGRSPVVCSNTSLAVGAPQVFTLVVKLDTGDPGAPIGGRADVSSSIADPNQANNSDTETTAVVAASPVDATDSLMAVGQTTVLANAAGGTFTAKANDVVRYSPSANAYSLVFRGDGFTSLTGATIDGLAVDPATRDLILSFTVSRTVTGAGSVQSEDLVAFHPASPGVMTQGSFRLFFDGSDIGLTAAAGENIDAVDVGPNGTIYFSTQGYFDIRSGVRLLGSDQDIVACTAPRLGSTSSCSGLSTYRSGSALGLTSSAENIDAFDLTVGGNDILSTTGAYTAIGDSGQGTDAFACKSGTCSRFFTGAAHSLLRLGDIETGTLLP